MHEIGVFGKQTSCFFQAKAARTLLQDNVCFNGPRAGINWNDGSYASSDIMIIMVAQALTQVSKFHTD